MKTNHIYHHIYILFFVLSSNVLFTTSNDETPRTEKDAKKEPKESYEKYFEEQEKIYQDLLSRGISGVRPLKMSEALAEEIVAASPKQVNELVSDVEQSVFSRNRKNTILHGKSGTGKTCIAQAIAIKTQTPCLFFDAGDMSTQYMNSGVQNLSKIFRYAEKLEKKSGKPCIIIFDELEALTRKHTNQNNCENNILMSFWQKLDRLSDTKVVVIGTMNEIEELPVQITNRTSMIEVPLSNLEQRKRTLFCYFKASQDECGLTYSQSISNIADSIARQTEGFSNRDLQNVADEATKLAKKAPAMPDRSNKIVMDKYFDNIIKQIKKDPKRKLEREIGTRKHTFKTYLRDPRALGVVGIVGMLFLAYNQRQAIKQTKENSDNQSAFQEKSFALQLKTFELQQETQISQKEALDLQKQNTALQIAHHKENMAHQKESMELSKKISEYQASDEHMARQAKINKIDWERDSESSIKKSLSYPSIPITKFGPKDKWAASEEISSKPW